MKRWEGSSSIFLGKFLLQEACDYQRFSTDFFEASSLLRLRRILVVGDKSARNRRNKKKNFKGQRMFI